jgi:diacylglycerol kinase (ATP)
MPIRYIHKRYNSFRYAIKGIGAAFRSEQNMQLHVLAAVLVVLAGLFFDISRSEWGLIALAIGLVSSAEIMNTAVETVVNLVSPEQHPLAGKAKDLAAGAVLVAAITALLIGLLVFGPKIWAYFYQPTLV